MNNISLDEYDKFRWKPKSLDEYHKFRWIPSG